MKDYEVHRKTQIHFQQLLRDIDFQFVFLEDVDHDGAALQLKHHQATMNEYDFIFITSKFEEQTWQTDKISLKSGQREEDSEFKTEQRGIWNLDCGFDDRLKTELKCTFTNKYEWISDSDGTSKRAAGQLCLGYKDDGVTPAIIKKGDNGKFSNNCKWKPAEQADEWIPAP